MSQYPRLVLPFLGLLLLSSCSTHLYKTSDTANNTNILRLVIDTDGDHIPDTTASKAPNIKFANGFYHGVVLHNNDDDNGDNVLDDTDNIINGEEDIKDLFPIKVELGSFEKNGPIYIRIGGAIKGAIGIYHQQLDGNFVELNTDDTIEIGSSTLQKAPMLFIEGREFASNEWDGNFWVFVSTAPLQQLSRQALLARTNISDIESSNSIAILSLRVAPWLMLSNASKAETMYIREDIGRNDKMITQLKSHMQQSNTRLHVIPASAPYPNSEIWIQDTLEIGRQFTPFTSMPVVLQANRGRAIDNFSKDTLLGKDFGWMSVGEYREKFARGYVEGADNVGWMDWFGNLEVSPPLPGYPHGRMYYGEAAKGVALDPAIVSKVAAQNLQSPFTLDVSFLMIKHADELLSWVPGKDGRWYLLVPSPQAMLELATSIKNQGHGNLPILSPFVDNYSINALLADTATVAHNMRIEDGPLARNILTLQRELGIQDDQIIKIPAWVNNDGTSLIPNMVNSVLMNGLFIVPEPHGPLVDGIDLLEQDFRERMAMTATTIEFVDDQSYHSRWGNVHCATHVKRNGDEHFKGLFR